MCDSDSARFIRRDALPGVEALHATFIRHRYTPHVHDDVTIACVDRGAARFALENHDHVAPAGTVFVIPPQAVHTGEPATVAGYTYRVLYLDPAPLAARLECARLPYTWSAATTVELLQAGERPCRVAARCGFYDQAHLNRHFKLAAGVTPTRYAQRSER